ncbi:MAG: PASTA domain-containing protein [Firmicutes bacterium]|nr:PASTA domain-containing protein [Bacillota bacterium]
MNLKGVLIIKKRITMLFLLVFAGVTVLTGRLFFIQVIRAGYYQQIAEDQRLRDIPLQPKRGIIFDRNHRPLAMSFNADCIYAIPAQVREAKETAKTVAGILNMPEKRVYSLLTRNLSFVWLKMKATPEEADLIRRARLPGIKVIPKAQRFYPQGKLAAQVLGFVGIDNQGLEGLERYYDAHLRGIPGSQQAEFDSRGQSIPLGERRYIPPQDGSSIVLTIDERIQHIAERELEKAVLEQGAKRGTIIVMDPMNGEILAMASFPGFDPNSYQEYPAALWRNWAVTDQYEPGSTFKILTAAAALEEGIVRRNSVFFDPGYIMVDKARLSCWRAGGHGRQTFLEATENSCNPVFATLALRLGKEKLYSYLEAFGFGSRSGIDFPGEGRGIVPPLARVKNVELATIGFGQGISVTPLQLLQALSVIANGGCLLQPRLVREVRSPGGEVVEKYEKKVIRRVISQETAKETALLLESVVEHGSGNRAQIPGYRVAGKTGTAQKPVGGIYGAERVASFLGFSPVENPRVAVIVILDEPQGLVKYGGVIAAPVFAAVVRDILYYLGVPPEVPQKQSTGPEALARDETTLRSVPNLLRLTRAEARKILTRANLSWRELGEGDYVMEQNPKAGAMVPPGTTILLYYNEKAKYNVKNEPLVLVPDLTGLSVEKAGKVLQKMGLKMVPHGAGLAVKQIPAAGTRLGLGMTVNVYFLEAGM